MYSHTAGIALFWLFAADNTICAEAAPVQGRSVPHSDYARRAPSEDSNYYPPLNVSFRIEGRVLVGVTVNASGRPYEIEVLASEASLKGGGKPAGIEKALERFRNSARNVALSGRYDSDSHGLSKKRISVVYGIEPCSPPNHYSADHMVTLCVPVPIPRKYD
jgi:hypothetical protein